MQNYKIETNSELIYEDGSYWSTLIFIKFIGRDTLYFTLPSSEVLDKTFTLRPSTRIVEMGNEFDPIKYMAYYSIGAWSLLLNYPS